MSCGVIVCCHLDRCPLCFLTPAFANLQKLKCLCRWNLLFFHKFTSSFIPPYLHGQVNDCFKGLTCAWYIYLMSLIINKKRSSGHAMKLSVYSVSTYRVHSVQVEPDFTGGKKTRCPIFQKVSWKMKYSRSAIFLHKKFSDSLQRSMHPLKSHLLAVRLIRGFNS